MKRFALFPVVGLLLFSACLDDRKQDDGHAAVRSTADEAFQHLMAGDVDAYLDMTLGFDTLPEEYQSQLRDLMLQYLYQDSMRHGKLTGVRVEGDSLFDTLQAEAYVELQWADSLRERVHVFLHKHNGQWRLK